MNEYLIEEVALLYYENDMSQQDIAKYLNLSKMNVSRLLQKAKETKVVHTLVKLPYTQHEVLQQEIKDIYGLEDVIVASDSGLKNSDSIREFLGKIAAFTMILTEPADSVIGMGVGETVGNFVKSIIPITTEGLHVVQLMGGLPTVSPGNPFSIVQESCSRLSAQGTYLTYYAIVEEKGLRDKIFENDILKNGLFDLWKSCSVSYFGIGSISTSTFFVDSLNESADLDKIKAQGTIGDILGHCFDIDGNFLETHIEDRLVSIPIEQLRSIEKRIAIAGGVEKVPAIVGALRTGIVTHLIIDEKTAQEVVKYRP